VELLSAYLNPAEDVRLLRAAFTVATVRSSTARLDANLANSVVIARLNDDQALTADGIDEPMLVGDPARPVSARGSRSVAPVSQCPALGRVALPRSSD